MGSAWDALGLAYDQLKKYDEAAAAIQKQIDLDPYDKRAYGDLGLVLKGARKRDAAAKAYAKHVELNALDGDAFKELGYLYNDLNRFPEAAAALEKAAGLLEQTRVGAGGARVCLLAHERSCEGETGRRSRHGIVARTRGQDQGRLGACRGGRGS